ncbi:MAG: hypothetical protein KatS3mg102_0043 [Planctomycetota bacterium]|nr:MAG: hypothetical protein KatS3mg102_0043 [Planctomycetota bacterium]
MSGRMAGTRGCRLRGRCLAISEFSPESQLDVHYPAGVPIPAEYTDVAKTAILTGEV